jgi:hypothetical protein
VQHFRSLTIGVDHHDMPGYEHFGLTAMLGRLQWLLLILLVQLEQFGRSDGLSRQSPAGGGDRRDTSPRRLHPPHPDPQQVLPAVSGLFREVSRLDAPALDERFEARDSHVQYVAY